MFGTMKWSAPVTLSNPSKLTGSSSSCVVVVRAGFGESSFIGDTSMGFRLATWDSISSSLLRILVETESLVSNAYQRSRAIPVTKEKMANFRHGVLNEIILKSSLSWFFPATFSLSSWPLMMCNFVKEKGHFQPLSWSATQLGNALLPVLKDAMD